jgi:hypothetical protein
MRIMTKLGMLTAGVLVAGAATVVSVSSQTDSRPAATAATSAPAARVPDVPPAYAPKVLHEKSDVDKATEMRVINDAAKTAWAFVDQGYVPETGLVKPSNTWPYPTIWDIGSSIGSYYAARGLGFITDEEYKQRTKRALETLAKARMYQDFAYGRNYDARTGELVGLDQKPSEDGTGYSSMDLGRLLVWLKIVSRDPELAPLAQQVAVRLNAKQIIKGGYLQGEQITKEGHFKYQEGRLGYEQYAATGFALWGMNADKALRMGHNTRKTGVMGIPVWADKRKLDRLTSEPFIMHGLELGLSGEMRELAWQTLALQAKRYEQTGQITMASEDALNDKPHYFYYYCVYCSGKPFTINVHKPGVELDEPRWMSSKAAFAWHAIAPSKYTWLAIRSVERAQQPGRGWATGVYEKTGKSTQVLSLNTAALILESALYYKTGQPMIKS